MHSHGRLLFNSVLVHHCDQRPQLVLASPVFLGRRSGQKFYTVIIKHRNLIFPEIRWGYRWHPMIMTILLIMGVAILMKMSRLMIIPVELVQYLMRYAFITVNSIFYPFMFFFCYLLSLMFPQLSRILLFVQS